MALASEPAAPTVEQAVATALAHPAIEARLKAESEAITAGAEAATTYPLPQLQLTHNHTGGGVDETESVAQLSWRVDLTDWRSPLKAAARHRVEAAQAQMAQRRLAVSLRVRRAFYRVLYFERRVEIQGRWVARLEGALNAVQARASRGDASPLAVGRIQREIQIAQAHASSEALAQAQAWAGLARWTGWTSTRPLAGALIPPASPPERISNETTEAAGSPETPQIVALEARERALATEAGAWGSPFWRNWQVGAGARRGDMEGETGLGFNLMLKVPLALWNPDAPKVAQLKAARAEVEATLSLERQRTRQAIVAAEARLAHALAALSRAAPSDAGLVPLAESAWAAGELPLSAFLDVLESEARLARAQVDLAWAARQAAIDLRQARGEEGAR